MMSVQRLRAALQTYPMAVDVVIAAVIFSLTLTVRHPDAGPGAPAPAAAVVLAACAALALTVRRRWPRVALAVAALFTAVATVFSQGRPIFTVAVAVALYTVAVRTGRRSALIAAIATAVTLAVAAAIQPPGNRVDIAFDVLSPLLGWVGISAAVGDAVRSRRSYVAAIKERAVRAEQTRDEEARRQVAEERLRIARELHDVVAHHVAVVSVQAGLAGHLILKQPHAAKNALQHVQQASAAILDELTGLLSVLRQPDESAPSGAPAPGLHQLDALVTSYTATGLQVTWSLTGQPRSVSGTVDLVAFRVVQEALTNAHKHGAGTAQVAVTYTPSAVRLEVSNPMRQSPTGHHGAGHGLIGMRERAAAVGGALQAGPGSHGDFLVTATLPAHPGVS